MILLNCRNPHRNHRALSARAVQCQSVVPVSYTHLDVYKRQALDTVTTDAVYRQTMNKEAAWRALGCAGVDKMCIRDRV